MHGMVVRAFLKDTRATLSTSIVNAVIMTLLRLKNDFKKVIMNV